ncbi:MAG: hypothetical protein ABR915_13945 [Thermoguttaceae bacterium]|jgi:hypothetical protein
MGRRFVLWHACGKEAPQKMELAGPVWLSAAGLAAPGQGASADTADGVLLLPANVGKKAAVAAIVPDALDQAVSANREPLRPGLHQLGHEDRLQWGELSVSLAESQQADPAEYDPALHGDGQRCGRTKARLRPGDRIVICRCGTIFSERAYALGRPCEYCRHDPTQGEWAPPAAAANGAGLAELLGLLGAGRRGRGKT